MTGTVASSSSSQLRVPATVFSGFLGSGKTTIISHLIDDLQAQGVQVAYVKNEVGTDSIDEDIIRGKHILTKELLNGCICCTLVGSFTGALTEIVETIHPGRILIEASGVSDPVALGLSVQSHPLVQRDGMITIIDVVNYNGVPELNSVAQHQASFCDLIIFNKVEQVDEQRKIQVVGYVREVNNTAPIIEAPNGHVHPSMIFGLFESDLSADVAMMKLEKMRAEHDHAEHMVADQIETFTVESDASYTAEKLIEVLENLPQNIFRVKGFLNVDGKMTLINGVNQKIELSPVPKGFTQTQGKLVCIGFRVNELAEKVSELLKNSFLDG